jgi:hypothetical protein
MSQIFIADHHQIKRAGKGQMIVTAAVKILKRRNTLTVSANNFCIQDGSHIYSRRFLHDKGIATAPIVTIDRVEPHPPLTNMDLQPVAIMLQLVRPARPARRLLGDDWLERMNESSRRV